MKKRSFLIIILITLFLGVTIIYYQRNYFFEPKEIIASRKEEKVFNSSISMMYETSAGSGEYTETSESNWPKDGYIFNTNLSRCENGGTLTWDDTNKKVLMSSNGSDKCYVYFDKENPTLAEHIKSTYGTDSSLLLHNSSLTNGANDGSYRYSGASENVNNYVCFGSDATTCLTDNLYRIIGVFGDQVKLVKYDYVTAEQLGTEANVFYTSLDTDFNGNYKGNLSTVAGYKRGGGRSSEWINSTLNTTILNGTFLTNLKDEWSNKIATTTWKVGGTTVENIFQQTTTTVFTNEIVSPAQSTTYNAKVGLMYISDYGYSETPNRWNTRTGSGVGIGLNWIYIGGIEWTITRSTNQSGAFTIHYDGYIRIDSISTARAVRPVFYLEPSVKMISGNGTSSNPYRII